MPRKSSRLSSKRPSPAILSRKRKYDGDEEQESLCQRKRTMEHRSSDVNDNSNDCPDVIFSGTSDAISEIEIETSSEIKPERFTAKTPPNDSINQRFRSLTCTPCTPVRASPLPFLYWADTREVWNAMVKKDETYTRDKAMIDRHPSLNASMRSILLDWLIEVCEVYRLHRDTYYLAMDFVDRYLSRQSNVAKNQLQLIGTTALFMAAKMEEIYPPKLVEFAYTTDEACTEKQILDLELVMLKVLDFNLSPSTVIRWLNLYMQLHCFKNKSNSKGPPVEDYKKDPQSFLLPQFSPVEFVKNAKLLDLITLDDGCLAFNYSVLAAAALSFNMKRKDLLSVCGFRWSELSACVSWMTPFADVVKEDGPPPIKSFNEVSMDNSHNIQTHAVSLQLYEKAVLKKEERSSDSSSDILTPPKSTQKPSKRLKVIS